MFEQTMNAVMAHLVTDEVLDIILVGVDDLSKHGRGRVNNERIERTLP